MSHAERAKKIANLRAQIQKVAKARQAALVKMWKAKLGSNERARHQREVARLTKQLTALQQDLAKVRRTPVTKPAGKPAVKRKAPPASQLRVRPRPVSAFRQDPFRNVKITAANVRQLLHFYRAALTAARAPGSGVTRALIAAYAARMRQCLSVLASLPPTARRLAERPLSPLEEKSLLQRATVSAEADGSQVAEDIPPDPGPRLPDYPRPPPPLRVVDHVAAEEDLPKTEYAPADSVDLPDVSTSDTEVAPTEAWYTKPWVWIAGAAVAAVVFTQRARLRVFVSKGVAGTRRKGATRSQRKTV